MELMLKYWKPAAAAGAFALLLLAANAYLEQREARIRLESELHVKKELIAAEREKIREADERIQARAAETEKLVAEVEKLKARPTTVREIVRELPQYVPLSTPPELTPTPGQAARIPGKQGTEGPPPSGPDAFGRDEPGREPPALRDSKGEVEPSLVFSPDQARELRQFYLDCQRATLELRACSEDLQDWREKERAYERQIELVEKQRDSAIAAVRGGTFWTRLKRETRTAAGTTAGAAIGAAACSGSDGAGVALCAGAGALGGFIISHF